MKKILCFLFTLVFCSVMYAENSIKCTVTSGALKKPIEFSTISKFEKNIKTIAKAAAKATVEIEIPAGSEIRTDFNKSFLNNVELYKNYNIEYAISAFPNDKEWPSSSVKYYKEWFKQNIVNGKTTIKVNATVRDKKWEWQFLEGINYKTFEIEREQDANESAGYGRYTHYQIEQQCEKNKEAGLGSIPDALIEKQRNENELAGYGRVTDAEIENERNKNEAAGYGRLTDSEVEKLLEQERKANEAAGKGRLTNEEVRIATEVKMQELRKAEYMKYLKQAKKYESEKRWCYLLGLYYDEFLKAQIANNSQKVDFLGYESSKHDSKKSGNSDNYDAYYNAYKELRDLILSGKPGFGEYNDFQLHNEWKNLLIDAEKYGTEYGALHIGLSCKRVKLNYENSTADYEVVVYHDFSDRYKYTIDIIRRGYMKAYKEDWNDLPSVAKYPDSSYMKSGYEAGYKSLNSYYNDCAWPLGSVGGKTNIPGILTYKQGKWIPSESQRDGNFYRYTHDFDFKNGNAKPINRDFKFVNYSSKYKSIENAFAVDRAGGYYSEDGSAFCMNNTLYEVKINFIDKDGTEVIKPQSCLIANAFDSSEWRLMPSLEPQTKISLNGVSEEIVTKIDSKEVFPNICEVNLYYGEFNPDVNKGKSGFIKALNKKTLPLDKIK